MIKSILSIIFLIAFITSSAYPQSKLLIYMDLNQTDHLRAYGITYRALTKGYKADWLLNYRGGSFLIDYSEELAAECILNALPSVLAAAADVKELYPFV